MLIALKVTRFVRRMVALAKMPSELNLLTFFHRRAMTPTHRDETARTILDRTLALQKDLRSRSGEPWNTTEPIMASASTLRVSVQSSPSRPRAARWLSCLGSAGYIITMSGKRLRREAIPTLTISPPRSYPPALLGVLSDWVQRPRS